MKMINTSSDTIRVDSGLLPASSWKGEGERPPFVTLPPRGVVEVDDGYALRKRTPRISGNKGDPVLLPAAVTTMVPQLKPYGADAQRMYDTMSVDDLPHVRAAFAELERAGKASAGSADEAFVQAKIEHGIAKGLAHAMGLTKKPPPAEPIFEIAPEDGTDTKN